MSVARQTKKSVFRMYNGRCAYCGAKLSQSTVTIDHVFPKSKGGMRSPTNIKPSCVFCNGFKRDYTVESFRKHLLREAERKSKLSNLIRHKFKIENKRIVFYYEAVAMAESSRRHRIDEVFRKIEQERKENDKSRENQGL